MAVLTISGIAPGLGDWQRDGLAYVLRPTGGAVVGVAGGKRCGKSVFACAAASMLAATADRPDNQIAVVMDTYARLCDVHLPIMSQLAPSVGGTWAAGAQEFRWPGGAVVRFRHLDVGGSPLAGNRLEGQTLTAIIGDELQEAHPDYGIIFGERLSHALPMKIVDPQTGCEQTVLRHPSLVMIGLPMREWWFALTRQMGGRTYRPRTRDNARNLAPGYEERLRASMTERYARSMLDGEAYTPEGQIVEEFIARLEPDGVLTDWTPDWEHTRTMLAMDLGVNNPHALLFAEDAERGRWVVMREWYSTGRKITLGEFCRRINADCTPRRLWSPGSPLIPLDSIVTDPAGASTSAHSGHSDLDLIAGARPDGLGIRPTVETIPERRSIVGSLNRMRLAIERRRLMFSRALIETGMRDDTERSLARSLLGYRWDPRGRDEPLKDDVHDHACDALRYGMRRVLWHVVEYEPSISRPQVAAPAPPQPDALRAAKGMS